MGRVRDLFVHLLLSTNWGRGMNRCLRKKKKK